MPWIQITLQTVESQVESITGLLDNLGALSVTYRDAADQPLFEPPPGETPLWMATMITGLFEATTDLEQIMLTISSQTDAVTGMRGEILEDKDWVRAWMDHYHPMQFGHDLWVVPSHHSPPNPHATNILLDPGMAFGTGTHPTTAMCLSWLAEHPPQDKRVVDFGCGSGILAIAAAKLGASAVFAIDNDPQALMATRENARQNEVHTYITVMGVEATFTDNSDVLVANILSRPLISLARHFSEILCPDGTIALSGILEEQADEVIAAYSAWFDLVISQQRENWVLLSGHRLAV